MAKILALLTWSAIALGILLSFDARAELSEDVRESIRAGTFPEAINFDGQDLVLNCHGKRKSLGRPVYHAGLYLEQKTTNGDEVINSSQTKLLVLRMLFKVSGKRMAKGLEKGLDVKHDEEFLDERDEIRDYMEDLERLVKDEIIEFRFLHDAKQRRDPGLEFVVHREGTPALYVEGREFSNAALGIWFADKVADNLKDLKALLLGGCRK